MALKDWKKNKKYKNHYINKYTKETLSMVFDYMGSENKWLVLIMDEEDDVIAEKTFNTKAPALRHAIAYMSKN